MTVGIIDGEFAGWSDHKCAVLYDTVTDWAFGPIFENSDIADAFLDYLLENNLGSPRSMRDTDLKNHYHEFLKLMKVEKVMNE